MRFERTGNVGDVGRAIAAERFNRSGGAGDLDEAMNNWDAAAKATLSPISIRACAASAACQTAARWCGPAAAVAAHRTAIDLVPLVAWRGIAADDQRHLLQKEMPSIAVDAAACFLAAGLTADSLRALELGRGGVVAAGRFVSSTNAPPHYRGPCCPPNGHWRE
jgi:hypothetical protein